MLEEIGITPPSYPTINRRLPIFATQQWRQRLAGACAAHVGLGPATLVLYDVTTLYFEIDDRGWVPRARVLQGTPAGAADHRRIVDRCTRVPAADQRLRRQQGRNQDHPAGDPGVRRRSPAARGDRGRRRRHAVGGQPGRAGGCRAEVHRRGPDPRRALPGQPVAPHPSRRADPGRADLHPALGDGHHGRPAETDDLLPVPGRPGPTRPAAVSISRS